MERYPVNLKLTQEEKEGLIRKAKARDIPVRTFVADLVREDLFNGDDARVDALIKDIRSFLPEPSDSVPWFEEALRILTEQHGEWLKEQKLEVPGTDNKEERMKAGLQGIIKTLKERSIVNRRAQQEVSKAWNELIRQNTRIAQAIKESVEDMEDLIEVKQNKDETLLRLAKNLRRFVDRYGAKK